MNLSQFTFLALVVTLVSLFLMRAVVTPVEIITNKYRRVTSIYGAIFVISLFTFIISFTIWGWSRLS